MSEGQPQGQTDPTSQLGSIEASYGKPIPEWQQVLRATPGYGEQGGRKSHDELVSLLRSDYGMSDEHAHALVEHTLAEDQDHGRATKEG